MGLPGTAVAAAAAAGALAGALAAFCGAAVGAAELVLVTGVDVAEDPQANSRATNSRTMALGRNLLICEPSRDFGILEYLLLAFIVTILTVSHM